MLMRTGQTGGHAIARNSLLNGLSADDRSRLAPHLREITLSQGARVLEADEATEHLYFPVSGFFALQERVVGRGRVEIAVVGCEGLLGWSALLGLERSTHDAVVQGRNGTVLSIRLDSLLPASRASATLTAVLLGFINSIIVQMSRTIASTIESSIGQRVARWLLIRHDRILGDQIMARHDEIAAALGVRRASVTDWLHVIEGERFVRCTRGRIVILDRTGLERFAGPAYGAFEARYRRFLVPAMVLPQWGRSSAVRV